MKIVCPDCRFTKDVSAEDLPTHVVIANCPKCGCRFRFSPEKGVLEKVQDGSLPPEAFGDPEIEDNRTLQERREVADGELNARAYEQAEGTDPRKNEMDQGNERNGRDEEDRYGDERYAQDRRNDPGQVREDDPLPEGAIVVKRKGGEEENDRDDASEDGRNTRRKGDRNSGRNDDLEDDLEDAYSEGTQSARWRRPQEKAHEEAGRKRTFLDDNPSFGMPWYLGWVAALFQTVLLVMFSAPRFFRRLGTDASIYRPLLFFITISVLEFLFNDFWMTVLRSFISTSKDAQLAELMAMLAPQGNVFLMLLLHTSFATLKLYLMSALLFGAYRLLTSERLPFILVFQVVAYAIAPCILAIVPLAGSLVGAVWSLACMILGLRQVFSLSWAQTIAGFIPLLLCYALMFRFVVNV